MISDNLQVSFNVFWPQVGGRLYFSLLVIRLMIRISHSFVFLIFRSPDRTTSHPVPYRAILSTTVHLPRAADHEKNRGRRFTLNFHFVTLSFPCRLQAFLQGRSKPIVFRISLHLRVFHCQEILSKHVVASRAYPESTWVKLYLPQIWG